MLVLVGAALGDLAPAGLQASALVGIILFALLSGARRHLALPATADSAARRRRAVFARRAGVTADHAAPRLISPADLLGRTRLDKALPVAAASYAGRVVMITGAGGSIGAELCRQLIALRPRKLVFLERSEPALYALDMGLRAKAAAAGIEVVPVLGSVTDARLLRRTLTRHAVEVVLHAAAYKHVPMVEMNPIAGLVNNVIGTRRMAEAARAAGVRRFILISTDKAVRPQSVMGASKRLAEIIVQDLARHSANTLFSMVRFGNVLGSSGSVVPLFQAQIARGGPVTLTHGEASRYFMTIREAARLVLLAGGFARGGDTFVLDMGAPVSIRHLARQMIEASGCTVRDGTTPDGDIEIITTGLRPGEKLHEELLIGDNMLPTPHPKILRARESCPPAAEITQALRELAAAIAAGDDEVARAVIGRWVEGMDGRAHHPGQSAWRAAPRARARIYAPAPVAFAMET